VGLPRLRPLPSILLAVTVLAELGAVGLSWGLEPAWDTLLFALSALLTVGTGALILSRHPGHAVGWLLCVLGLVDALSPGICRRVGVSALQPRGGPAAFLRSGSRSRAGRWRRRCWWRSSCCSPPVTCPAAAGRRWCG
jgi:hypothetical protein